MTNSRFGIVGDCRLSDIGRTKHAMEVLREELAKANEDFVALHGIDYSKERFGGLPTGGMTEVEKILEIELDIRKLQEYLRKLRGRKVVFAAIEERTVFELYFFDGVRIWRIAENMGVTTSRINRLLKKVRKNYKNFQKADFT